MAAQGNQRQGSARPLLARAWKRPGASGILALLILWLSTALYHHVKPLPAGLDHAGAFHSAPDATFLRDITCLDAEGARQRDQQIFDRILETVGQAEHLLVLDLFLFNDHLGAATNAVRPLSGELTEAIVRRRLQRPGLRCWFITDPINTVYGGQDSVLLDRLRRHGVTVVTTRLSRLRDSNPAYSAGWRMLLRAWPRRWGPMLPNPFGRGRVPLRSYLDLLNFKANHRKTVIADRRGELVALVSSANPHDGSSAHHNVALEFSGGAVDDLLATEAAVCALSGQPIPESPFASAASVPAEAPVQIRILTERAIETACLELIRDAQPGDPLEVAMFYLSSRPVVRALTEAWRRGVQVRVFLDPNKDAFGIEKNGIPNRPVAAELARAGIPIRWAATHGEQFHAKLIWHRSARGVASAILGSANYTRRNLRNYNLETSVELRGSPDAEPFRSIREYWERIWNNAPGQFISSDYSVYADPSRLRYWLYRVQEATGLSTF